LLFAKAADDRHHAENDDREVLLAMSERTFNVLFLCTGNSARSILAESYLNAMGRGRFRAHSAGSHPTGKVSPYALEILQRNRIPAQGLRSKGWDEFAQPGAPSMDIIITVCDQTAGEICPVWPGKPVTAHWGVEDPAAAAGDDDARRAAFVLAFSVLQKRIALLVNLNADALDHLAMEQRLKQIGTDE
jgi:arsenate reductase